MRRQAIDWLKTELTVWDKLLAFGPPQARPFIVQTLSRSTEPSNTGLGASVDRADDGTQGGPPTKLPPPHGSPAWLQIRRVCRSSGWPPSGPLSQKLRFLDE